MKSAGRIGLLALILVTTVVFGCLGRQEDRLVRDEEVKVLHWEELAYPSVARDARVPGVVVVRSQLDDAGNVTSSAAVSGNKLLVPDSLSNSKKWRFQPNSRKSAIIVYDFRLDGPPANVRAPPNLGSAPPTSRSSPPVNQLFSRKP